MSKKFDLDEIDPEDPTFEMLGSRYSQLVGKDARLHKPRHRDDGDVSGGGQQDRKHRKHHRDRHE
ncbi:MAG: hypothetical protein OEW35_14505 [Gammaproteobacteria bacterium]|nr:hypothetical protein [Gammaproteobacteria bacterium]MDH4254879.1 hypothetical protein [Gammaproteobacteria bacterium]MDH5310602.1 hypothetical protein [Gammaproteobacteria bacterium]